MPVNLKHILFSTVIALFWLKRLACFSGLCSYIMWPQMHLIDVNRYYTLIYNVTIHSNVPNSFLFAHKMYYLLICVQNKSVMLAIVLEGLLRGATPWNRVICKEGVSTCLVVNNLCMVTGLWKVDYKATVSSKIVWPFADIIK